MIIAESIRVEVYKYNYAAHSYDLVTTLTESSIISAGGKRQCCADGTFEIGGVYAATFSSLDNKWIPVICGISGGILGIAALFWMPDFPVQDVLSAAAVGIVSGLAATGTNQIFKQFRS